MRPKHDSPELTTSNKLYRARRMLIPNVGTIVVVILLLSANHLLANNGRATASQLSSTTTLNYQGHLLDSAGQPIDTTVPITFRLYTSYTGGTPLWTELHPTVPVQAGLFNVVLGSINALPTTLFHENDLGLWLGVEIDDDGEMMPHERIGSVPVAAIAQGVVSDSIEGDEIGASFGESAQTLQNYVSRYPLGIDRQQIGATNGWIEWDVRALTSASAESVIVYIRITDDNEGTHVRLDSSDSGDRQRVVMTHAKHFGLYKGYGEYTFVVSSNGTIRFDVVDYGTSDADVSMSVVGWYEPANR